MKNDETADSIAVGAQPSETDVGQLAQSGFQSIVDLRLGNEPDQPLGPGDEARLVMRSGLHYVHIPVDMAHLTEEQITSFSHEMDRLERPVFIHCSDGTRAKVLLAIYHVLKAHSGHVPQTLHAVS